MSVGSLRINYPVTGELSKFAALGMLYLKRSYEWVFAYRGGRFEIGCMARVSSARVARGL